jgi:ribonuclease P protein component
VKREQRLRTPAEFRRVREASQRVWPHPLLVLYIAPNDLGQTRVGITVSSRVGKAVVRNRVRRRLREALRARLDHLGAGNDVLVIARPASAQVSWRDLCAALDTVLRRASATVSAGARV